MTSTAVVQALEPRRLLAADDFAQIIVEEGIGRILVVTGTDADDVITVQYSTAGDRYVATLNGDALDFDPLILLHVRVNAGDGNDSVYVATRTNGPADVPPMRRATLSGEAGNDTLTAAGGDDRLEGGDGNDLLDAGSGSDALFGGGGDDQLFGRSGTDELNGGLGADLLDGGSSDTPFFGDGASYADRTEDLAISLDGLANDGASGEGDNVVNCSDIQGGSGADLIVGDSDRNRLRGLGGGDTLRGQGGDDQLFATASAFDESPETVANELDGGSGRDGIHGSGGNDTLFGRGEDDTLDGGGGNDSLDGGAGADSIDAGAGDDDLSGRAGDDTLNAGDGDDLSDGGSGNDELPGGSGSNTVRGQSGDDVISGGGTGAIYSGGSGEDAFTVTDTAVTITLDGVANDGAAGSGTNVEADFETIVGSSGHDLIDASARGRRVFILGASGNDTIIGSAGDDTLEASRGDDSIIGGDGNDILIGDYEPFDGTDGEDTLLGGNGDDMLSALDEAIDSLDGGAGDDSAERDLSLDLVSNVETFV